MTSVPPELAARAATALLAAVRLLPVAIASPFLGGPLVPPVVRVALAAGLGAVVATLRPAALPPDALTLANSKPPAVPEPVGGTVCPAR